MPDVIKIDVEGAEARVPAGAATVLRARPCIICEVAKENATAVSNLLAASGYTLYDGEQLDSKRLPTDEALFNTLAVSGSLAGIMPRGGPVGSQAHPCSRGRARARVSAVAMDTPGGASV